MNKLLEELQTAGIESCSLDSVVDDAASRQASDTNNKGIKSQLRYLMSQGMSSVEIKDALGID